VIKSWDLLVLYPRATLAVGLTPSYDHRDCSACDCHWEPESPYRLQRHSTIIIIIDYSSLDDYYSESEWYIDSTATTT